MRLAYIAAIVIFCELGLLGTIFVGTTLSAQYGPSEYMGYAAPGYELVIIYGFAIMSAAGLLFGYWIGWFERRPGGNAGRLESSEGRGFEALKP